LSSTESTPFAWQEQAQAMPVPRDGREIRVPVPLGSRAYEILVTSHEFEGVGRFAREALDATWAGQACRAALLVSDRNLAAFPYVNAAQECLAEVGIATETAVLPPGEATKSLESASLLYDRLIAMKADRHTAVVALGGGVIGDLAGFVAATYARGIPLLMIPTSLLAQVDSSVGGKVGVNHPRAKNVIGAFHQPAGVWIDTAILNTLPLRELQCGLAEVVKYGMILDAPFFEELETRVRSLLDRQGNVLRTVVAHCCRLKADVVIRDEREETGLRAVLNFGHTVGHAIESAAAYSERYQHGEAVAAGMVAECRLAECLGWIEPVLTERLINLLRRLGLPATIEGLDPDPILEAMSRDKKNQGGAIRFVLPRRLGHVELTDQPSAEQLREVVTALCS
jgi:3-dehydroquinate synthase